MNRIEQIMPLGIGIIIGYLFYNYEIACYCESRELIKQFVTIGTCSFGFLLTMFSLIIQSNSGVVKEMRKRRIPFKRFIQYNRKVVFLSFALTIYSYLIGYLNIEEIFVNSAFVNVLVSIFYGILAWFLIDTIYFLIIFYILIQDKNDTM